MLELYTKPTIFDLLAICHHAPEDEREQYEAFFGQKYDANELAARLSLSPGPSWVLLDDKKPIVAAGFELIRPGVWQDWMVSTEAAWSPANWRTVTRHVREVMDAMLKTDAHRLQCVSLRSRIQAHRWYKVLGLRQEGVLEAYGADGQDAIMFKKVRSDG